MRRILSALIAAGSIAVAVPLAADPAAADTQFFDVAARKWVTVKPSRAEMERAYREKYARRVVAVETQEKPGTIVIDTDARFLYLIQPEGQAIRYGIGVGRDGFTWAGVQKITRKAEWPGWTPPAEMIARQPDLPRYMPGGPENPLGARALYLGNTLYRIHGTNESWTIGYAVSSGCIRLVNDDVIDLYNRVPIGAKVVVVGPREPMPDAYLSGVTAGVQEVASNVAAAGSSVASSVGRGVDQMGSSLGRLLPQ